MVFSIGSPPLREPAGSRCGGKDAQMCISPAVCTGPYFLIFSCLFRPLVEPDRSLRITDRLDQRGKAQCHALQEACSPDQAPGILVTAPLSRPWTPQGYSR